LDQCLEGKECQPFVAPADVRLTNDDVVQPDLFVVCNAKQICETHVEGAPTIVIEIVSPSTVVHDRKRKMELYAAHGVRELWLVTPYPPLVEVFTLEGGRFYSAAVYGVKETLSSGAVPEISIDLARVFTFPVPPEDRVQLVEEAPAPYGASLTQDTGV
jgi:Uma2 family endonuclease